MQCQIGIYLCVSCATLKDTCTQNALITLPRGGGKGWKRWDAAELALCQQVNMAQSVLIELSVTTTQVRNMSIGHVMVQALTILDLNQQSGWGAIEHDS